MTEPCRHCAMPSDPESAFEDPAGVGAPIPLCVECRAWSEKLVESLKADPEFAARFESAIEKAETPSRFDRILGATEPSPPSER